MRSRERERERERREKREFHKVLDRFRYWNGCA
jgi:hypothetical protein